MEIVQFDLRRYLEKNIFPSRTVLVFPPFNGFRRFLIHKLIEDNFTSSGVAAFSIGQDISRRIVVCYKGLVKEGASKGLPTNTTMIDKEKPSRQKLTPTAAVYRPPAARLAETRQSMENVNPSDTKKTRVRRPDQQMYVPRPKRASYGNDHPRSRSHSSSRSSLDNERNVQTKSDESRISKKNVTNKNCCDESNRRLSVASDETCDIPACVSLQNDVENLHNKASEIATADDALRSLKEDRTISVAKPDLEDQLFTVDVPKDSEKSVSDLRNTKTIENKIEDEMQADSTDSSDCSNVDSKILMVETNTEKISSVLSQEKDHSEHLIEDISKKRTPSQSEHMETISISSDSRSENSSSSFTSSSDSKTSDTSVDSEAAQRCSKVKNSEKMDIDEVQEKNDVNKEKHQVEEKTRKAISPPCSVSVSEVLVISDSSSSEDSGKSANHDSEKSSNTEKMRNQPSAKFQDCKVKNPVKEKRTFDPNESDWESLYDDTGECLVPTLMEELTNSLGRVKVSSTESDYRPYQSIEERTNDGECIIEIYDFPAEFKTTDLFNIFAAYRNKNFQIKWVDDTHALGVFPSPLMADEVLACTLPFVKTRPLRLGIAESRSKARNLVLPPLPSMERPKTCTALARRLVTGALGLRIPTTSQEREKEKKVLKEAREKRRLEAKQREAAWDGTITSDSCI